MGVSPQLRFLVKSEVLVLGAMCPEKRVVLLEPSFKVNNGVPIG